MPELSSNPVYTIGVASELLGLSSPSLRVYEREGLIMPHRTSTKRRLYSDIELAKTRNIHEMIKEDGLNLVGIRHLLSLIPCWKIQSNGCFNCEHFNNFPNNSGPCWADNRNCQNDRKLCRECPVYRQSTSLCNLKEMIFPEIKAENRP